MSGVRIVPTEFKSSGQTIRGHFVTPETDGPFPGICKLHGLPGSPNQVGGVATRLAEAGFAVLTFDFRGFRSSDGYFSLAGEIDDSLVAISHLIESELTIDSWVGLIGASYGGAIAVCTAAQDSRVSAVCLRAPVYDTLWFAKTPMIMPMVKYLQDEAPDQMHGINDPDIVQRALRSMVEDAKRFNPMNLISDIAPRPILIVHGSEDKGIDLPGVKKLYERAREPKDLIVVDGANHHLSDPRAFEITMTTIISWFDRQRPV